MCVLERVRRIGGAEQRETVFALTSLTPKEASARRLLELSRGHWGIENRLHWVLDVVFRDDLARLRSGHGPENMAVVKHMALNLLRRAKPATSLKNRRKLAGWNLDYLDRLIRGAA